MKIFNLPDLGEGLAEAEIREWYVKEGDTVKLDQPLLSVETAKAVVDVPSPHAGKIKKLFGKNGELMPTHAPLVEFENGIDKEKDKGSVVGNLEESADVLAEETMIIGTQNSAMASGIKAMPAVRALARKLQIDLSQVQGHGADGQITIKDVEQFAEKKSKHDTTIKKSTVDPLHGARHFMAMAMTQSHQEVVPVTITDFADITHMSTDSDFTVHMIQAIITGIKAEPALNAWFDTKSMARELHSTVQLGLAIDTDQGLFVPVLRDIEQKDAQQLRQEINFLKKATKERTLSVSHFQGATITLSNFGMFAGQYATLIIVPPMVAIIGCGKIHEAVLPRQGKIEIRRIVPLSLSIDHRAITGGEATRFMAAVIKHLEKA